MVDMTREELTNDQKRIMSECYEERQRINAERSRLESAKMKYNKNNLDKVSVTRLWIYFWLVYKGSLARAPLVPKVPVLWRRFRS